MDMTMSSATPFRVEVVTSVQRNNAMGKAGRHPEMFVVVFGHFDPGPLAKNGELWRMSTTTSKTALRTTRTSLL
jgi:hypothetical protein